MTIEGIVDALCLNMQSDIERQLILYIFTKSWQEKQLFSSILGTYVDYLNEFKVRLPEDVVDVYLIKITSHFMELISDKYVERLLLMIKHNMKLKKLKFEFTRIPICVLEIEKEKKILKKEDTTVTLEEVRAGLRNDYSVLSKFFEDETYSDYVRKSVKTMCLARIETIIGLICEDKEQLHQFLNAVHENFAPPTALALLRCTLSFRKDLGDASNVEAICGSFAQQYGLDASGQPLPPPPAPDAPAAPAPSS